MCLVKHMAEIAVETASEQTKATTTSFDDLQWQIDDIGAITKEWQDKRYKRKSQQKDEILKSRSNDVYRVEIERLKIENGQQDEEIGKLYEIVQMLIRVIKTHLSVLRSSSTKTKEAVTNMTRERSFRRQTTAKQRSVDNSAPNKTDLSQATDCTDAVDTVKQKDSSDYFASRKQDRDADKLITESVPSKTSASSNKPPKRTTTLTPSNIKSAAIAPLPGQTTSDISITGTGSPLLNIKSAATVPTTRDSNSTGTSSADVDEHKIKNRNLERTKHVRRFRMTITKLSVDNRLEVYREEFCNESNRYTQTRSTGKQPSRTAVSSEDPNIDKRTPKQIIQRAQQQQEQTEDERALVPIGRRQSENLLDEFLPGREHDVQTVPLEYWDTMAKEEIEKAKSLRAEQPLKGQCSILCLDISASMRGEPWKEMESFVINYLQHAETVSKDHNLCEFIAMVTFGHESRVVHHATTDYQMLRSSFEKLRPGGPSPMYAGVVLSRAAATEGTFIYEECPFVPRVVMVTDGLDTCAELIAGPDNPFYRDRKSRLELLDRVQELAALPAKMFVVPVGNGDTGSLKTIARMTYGFALCDEEAKGQFFRTFRNYIMAVQIERRHKSDIRPLRKWVFDQEARLLNPSLSSGDMDNMLSFLRDFHLVRLEADDDKYMDTKIPGLPPVGTRVQRGPDWELFDTSDGNGPGTVVGIRPHGEVHVLWDHGGGDLYSYGGDYGVFDVVPCDNVRKFDGIAPGSLAKRGRHWLGGNEDGGPGSIGIAYRTEGYGLVHIRWPSGVAKQYKYGFRGKYEVVPCDESDVERYKKYSREYSASGGYINAPQTARTPLPAIEQPNIVTTDESMDTSYNNERLDYRTRQSASSQHHQQIPSLRARDLQQLNPSPRPGNTFMQFRPNIPPVTHPNEQNLRLSSGASGQETAKRKNKNLK